MIEEMYQPDLLFILMQKDIDVRKDHKMVTRKIGNLNLAGNMIGI